MAEGSVDISQDSMEDFVEVTVLSTGRTLDFTVPNFPVYKPTLREVKLQWEEFATETIHVFDAFAKECGMLNEQPLPAIAKIMLGLENAFIVEVDKLHVIQ